MAAQSSHVVSVRDLVRRRLGLDGDPWNLALVQRAEVWEQVRMRHLFDSLMAGYPIGAILLCRVHEASQVITTRNGERVVEDARGGDWQLLDGQQRINALFSMLSEQGKYGHFYLHMTAPRQATGALRRRESKDRTLRHIKWRQTADDLVPEREWHVDLTRWTAWAETRLREHRTFAPQQVGTVLRELDPLFTASLDTEMAEAAARRLGVLRDAWFRPSVPVLHAEVKSPLDVLEVFTRTNLGGVQVGGADVYFAAVKTFWPDAEQRLARVNDATAFLRHRFAPLRFISRLASRGLGHGDPIALNVEVLTGSSGQELRTAMQDLTERTSPVLDRILRFSTWMQSNSSLGFALHLVTWELWDDVLAWAAASEQSDEAWYARNQPLIEAYLLGASLYQYRQVLRDRFHRIAFLEALTAGADGKPFPLETILAVSRAGNALRGGRRTVPTLSQDRQQIADRSSRLLACLAQRIEFQPEDQIDWDHIFPSAEAKRMWVPGARGRKRHHPDRWRVNTAGNLWALKASANRSLQDTPPRRKFAQLLAWQKDATTRHRVWERERWSISESEVARFIAVDDLLGDDPGMVERGMQVFTQLVDSRTARLLDEALERFPAACRFDPEADIHPDDPSEVRDHSDALGITRPTEASPHSPARALATPLTSGWSNRDDELRWVVRRVVKRFMPGRRASPSRAGDGCDLRGYVPAYGDRARTHVAIALVSRMQEEFNTPFWAMLHTTTPGFDTALKCLLDSPLAEQVRYRTGSPDDDRAHAWIPLVADSALEWEELASVVHAQASSVIDLLAPSGPSRA